MGQDGGFAGTLTGGAALASFSGLGITGGITGGAIFDMGSAVFGTLKNIIYYMEQASDINAILTEINNLLGDKLSKKQLDEAESMVLEYLKHNSTDIDMWYKLVLLNLNFFHDEESAVNHLRTIHELFKDDKSIILICFIQDAYWGGIEQEDYTALQEQLPADNKLQACREFYLAKFRKDNMPDEDFVNGILGAIDLYDKYVDAYSELGYYFKDEKVDLKKSKTFFEKAIASVERELTLEDGRNDYFDIDFYFKEMVFGIYCTTPKLEFMKSFIKDQGAQPNDIE